MSERYGAPDELPQLLDGMMEWLYEEITTIDKRVRSEENLSGAELRYLHSRNTAFKEVIDFWEAK